MGLAGLQVGFPDLPIRCLAGKERAVMGQLKA